MSTKHLTVVSVLGPSDGEYWNLSSKLLRKYLTHFLLTMHVVDNYHVLSSPPVSNVTVHQLPKRPYHGSLRTRGSVEHSQSLGYVLAKVRQDSGLVLIVDPDFFVIKGSSLQELIDKIQANQTAMIATTWHNKWVTKSSDWVAPHFVLFDAAKIAPSSLDFSTGFEHHPSDKLSAPKNKFLGKVIDIVYSHTLGRFRKGTSLDTGHKVAAQLQMTGHGLLLLKPHVRRRLSAILTWLNRFECNEAQRSKTSKQIIRKSEIFKDETSIWAIHLRKQMQSGEVPTAAHLQEALPDLMSNQNAN